VTVCLSSARIGPRSGRSGASCAGNGCGSPPPLVDTVDKMQGQEADAVIVSYGVSDPEFAMEEAEFIYGLNRLNVAITRARSKCVVCLPRPLLDAPPQVLDLPEAARGLAYMRALVESVARCGDELSFELTRAPAATLYRARECYDRDRHVTRSAPAWSAVRHSGPPAAAEVAGRRSSAADQEPRDETAMRSPRRTRSAHVPAVKPAATGPSPRNRVDASEHGQLRTPRSLTSGVTQADTRWHTRCVAVRNARLRSWHPTRAGSTNHTLQASPCSPRRNDASARLASPNLAPNRRLRSARVS